MKSGGVHPVKPVDDKKKLKEEKLKELKEMALLFKPVQTQKVEKGELIIFSIAVKIIVTIKDLSS